MGDQGAVLCVLCALCATRGVSVLYAFDARAAQNSSLLTRLPRRSEAPRKERALRRALRRPLTLLYTFLTSPKRSREVVLE